MSVPVTSVGIRSGVNWMRLNLTAQRARHRAHQQRLGGAGQAGDEAVAADQQRDQQLLHDLVLADDQLAHFAADGSEGGAEPVDQLAGIGSVDSRDGHGVRSPVISSKSFCAGR
jgi:hypothetical protein